EAGGWPADGFAHSRLGARAGRAHQRLREANAAQVALRAAALVGELAGHLRPAVARLSHEGVVGDEGLVEGELVELVRAGHVDDRAYGQSLRVLQVHDELAQARMARLLALAGAHEGDGVVVLVGEGRPDLATGDEPAAVHL